MQKQKLIHGLIIILTISCVNSYAGEGQQDEKKGNIPSASQFVNSPLRTRVRLELNSPVGKVWALVGNPGRMPEYSAGLLKVDVGYNGSGNCSEYTCHFLPMQDGGREIVHREIIKWYEPMLGLASVAEEPNEFGLRQSLGLITLEALGDKTILSWEMYFNADNEEMLKMNLSAFEKSLNGDISAKLLEKFGGTFLEDYIEGR